MYGFLVQDVTVEKQEKMQIRESGIEENIAM